MTKDLLTGEELAARLRVRPSTVRTWARAGRIPTLRIGAKVIRFDFAEVCEMLRHEATRSQASGGTADER